MLEQTNGQFGATPNIEIIIGAAGTGKTHKIKEIITDLEAQSKSYLVVTFTNRAAKVLRERGIECATTIHKALYANSLKDPEEFKEVMIPIIDPSTRLPMRDERDQIIYGIEEEPVWQFAFKKDSFSTSDILIIDEASMVPSWIWGNIFDYWPGKLIIVGDQHQLPPVEMDDETRDERFVGFFDAAAKNPTLDLGGNENNRRVTDNNSVLPDVYKHIAKRYNGEFPDIDFDHQYNYVDLRKDTLLEQNIIGVLESADIVVTWRNDECKFINDLIRQRRAERAGIKHTPYPRAGDKIIALNHYTRVTTVRKKYWDKELKCEVEYDKDIKEPIITSGDEYTIESVTTPDAKNNVIWVLLEGIKDAVPLSTAHIDGGRATRALSPVKWTYGYAITCHKAQGSGWDTVVVIDSMGNDYGAKRWRYTAATRARQHLIAVRSGISFDKRKIIGGSSNTVDVAEPISENRQRLRDLLRVRFDQ